MILVTKRLPGVPSLEPQDGPHSDRRTATTTAAHASLTARATVWSRRASPLRVDAAEPPMWVERPRELPPDRASSHARESHANDGLNAPERSRCAPETDVNGPKRTTSF
jgi:hypothetical protein